MRHLKRLGLLAVVPILVFLAYQGMERLPLRQEASNGA